MHQPSSIRHLVPLLAALSLGAFACGTSGLSTGTDGGDQGTGGSAATGGGSNTGGGAGTGGSTGSGGGAATGGGTGTGGSAGTGGSTGIDHVGPTGGQVNLMQFLVTGDTRPPICEDTAHYPTAIINAIADQAKARGVQFGLDLGDHMFVCLGSTTTATNQMTLYLDAVHRYPGTWFMTMGNHECMGPSSSSSNCLPSSGNANYKVYMSALSPLSSLPYYSFNVETSQGRATFVIVADNAWDTAQATWLESTLADADLHAKYTIVARHHPPGDTNTTGSQPGETIIKKHKYSLFLTGHSHTYEHLTTDQGRAVILGTGGAPLKNSTDFNGYAVVTQQANGDLQVQVINLAGNTVMDTWTAKPN